MEMTDEDAAQLARGYVSNVGGVKVVFAPLISADWEGPADDRGVDTPKAIVLHYHGRALWFPKVLVRLFEGGYYVARWRLMQALHVVNSADVVNSAQSGA